MKALKQEASTSLSDIFPWGRSDKDQSRSNIIPLKKWLQAYLVSLLPKGSLSNYTRNWAPSWLQCVNLRRSVGKLQVQFFLSWKELNCCLHVFVRTPCSKLPQYYHSHIESATKSEGISCLWFLNEFTTEERNVLVYSSPDNLYFYNYYKFT